MSRWMNSGALFVALSLGSLAPNLGAAGEPKLDWKGHSVSIQEAGLSGHKSAAALIPWAASSGYRVALSEDSRVLAIAKGTVSNPLGLATRTLTHEDDALGKSDAKSAIVIVQVASETDFGALLDVLAKTYPDLASWCKSAKATTGFLLPDPNVGAFLERPKDIKSKEWHPQNELVNRVALLDLHQRFGRMPYWLECGFAWRAEIAVCNNVYCFPGRSGFVGVGEHRGWVQDLAGAMSARGGKPLEMRELADYRRGTYDKDLAARAWGTAEYLVHHEKEHLAALFAGLAEIRDHDGRTTHADGTWETIANYEIPVDRQLEVFRKSVHPEFLAEITRYFAQGSSFTPKPPDANH